MFYINRFEIQIKKTYLTDVERALVEVRLIGIGLLLFTSSVGLGGFNFHKIIVYPVSDYSGKIHIVKKRENTVKVVKVFENYYSFYLFLKCC